MYRCLCAFAATLLFLALGGCQKNQAPPPTAAPSAVSATIGGTAFAPTTVRFFYTRSGQYWGITGYTINGKSGDTTSILLNILPPLTINAVLTNNNSGLYVRYALSGGRNYFAGTGYGSASMTLTTLDTVGQRIAGTFRGALHNAANGGDSVVITDGRFNSTYQVTP